MENLNENLSKVAHYFESDRPAFAKHLQDIRDACDEFMKIAPTYDLNHKLPFNGVRSFVKIISIFSTRLKELSSESPGSRQRKRLQEYADLAPLLVRQTDMMKLVIKRSHGLETSDYGSSESLDTQILEALMQLGEPDVRPVFALGDRNFWLCPSLRRVLNLYLNIVLFEAFGIRKLFACSQRTKYHTRFSLNASVNDLKRVWSAGEKCPNRAMIKFKAFPGGHVSSIRLMRQREWVVPASGSITHKQSAPPDANALPDKRQTVKVMLIRYGSRGVSPGDSLIVHIHGGGFVALSPKSHEGYLRRWSKRLRVPVMSIDYRLSPEHRYPCALQDVLDAFLFLTSGTPDVQDKIGFHPKNIVLCGDSAGGNLAVALTFVLSDIRKLQPDIWMPKAVSVQFPVANLVVGCVSPSRVLSAIDCFLGIGVGMACMAAYPSAGPDEDRKAGVRRKRSPWYRSNQWTESVQRMQTKLNEPYVNLLSGNFDQVSDVPLYIQACEFDPLLDDAIHICRLWRGPVHLDVIENVMHGFLAFQDFSDEARRGGDVCAERLQQALQLD